MLLIFIGHLIACCGVVFRAPGGWGWWSAETLVYRLLPVAVGAAIVLAIVRPSWRGMDRLMLALLAGAWLAALILSLVMFPVSGRRIAVGASLAIAILALAMMSSWKASADRRRMRSIVAATVGALLAVTPIRLLRSPLASTLPIGGDFAPLGGGTAERRTLRLDPQFALDTTQATVTVNAGRRYAYIEPVLTFVQRSPDACWTIFAPREERLPPGRSLQSTSQSESLVEATYIDSAMGEVLADDRLSVRRAASGRLEIDAATNLQRTIWSHLNTYTQLTIAGHRKLRVRFSPAPAVAIDVKHAGYPFGAPARFAYADRDGRFRVVEASSAEKGPFRELASGRLDGPLTMTFLDGDEAFLAVELQDWAAQASRDLSPTAGWGVPQNGIEFGLLSEDPKSPATVFISLASTGVGRGWNSVGHAPGVYRNRMKVTVTAPEKFEATRPAS